MNWKNMTTLFGVLLLGTGLVFALSGATADASDPLTRWTTDPGNSVTTEGGNITPVNLTSDSLTDKWAAFYGNVSGNIVLTDDTSYGDYSVYNWSVSTTDGEVCATTNSSVDTSLIGMGAPSPSSIDAAWGFNSADADSGENTFGDVGCSLEFNGVGSLLSLPNVSTGGATGTFETCLVSAGDAYPLDHGQTGFLLFCTNMSDGTNNYKGDSVNYELMVPTNNTADSLVSTTTTTYYFYAELN
jgi:hypothetical protein